MVKVKLDSPLATHVSSAVVGDSCPALPQDTSPERSYYAADWLSVSRVQASRAPGSSAIVIRAIPTRASG
jgi:hypothetical protein